MSAATEAFDRLHAAMLDIRPECVGLDLFTADELSTADVADLAAICETCPLLDLCREYAQLARPAAGIWAGRR